MSDEHCKEQIKCWMREVFDELRRKGATEEDLRDEACLCMVFRMVWERHEAQIREMKALFATAIQKMSPGQLRECAKSDRKTDPNSDFAYDLETLADNKEREGWFA